MKNIHVLPTDKPSRFFNTNKGQYNFRGHYVPDTIQTCKNHNIYITSNEEIKERNWCYHIDGEYDFPVQIKGIAPRTPTRRNVSILTSNSSQLAGGKYIKFVESCDISELKKIILTTDQELIANGVQAIDDGFLKWFVKNPSCEMVEISTYHVKGDISGKLHYKTIISQEQTTEEVPNELEPVLAKISHQNDLGNPKWYEVVYYVDGKWCSYSGSKTFEDGERVVEWVHCSEIF